jgi:hypothetical protein
MNDRDILFAVTGENQFYRSGKRFIKAGWYNPVVTGLGQLPQAFDDGFAWSEDQGILDKWPIRILQGHGKLSGIYGSDKHCLAGTHGQCQDVAGISQGQGFTQSFQFEISDKVIVTFNPFPQSI